MKKTTFQLAKKVGDDIEREPRAGYYEPDVPGLVVAKVLPEAPAKFQYWAIFHEESGRKVVGGGPGYKRSQALELLREIGGLADWTRSAEELNNQNLMDDVGAVVYGQTPA